jgi:hypothetical protein
VGRAGGGEPGELLHTRGHAVALALQLGHAQQRGARRRLERQRDRRDVREAGGDDPRQLALQVRDLAA